MSKDRKLVAKGTPRNRKLILVDDKKDKNRFLTYTSKSKAEAAFSNGLWFSTYKLEPEYKNYTENDLEAVECKMLLQCI